MLLSLTMLKTKDKGTNNLLNNIYMCNDFGIFIMFLNLSMQKKAYLCNANRMKRENFKVKN